MENVANNNNQKCWKSILHCSRLLNQKKKHKTFTRRLIDGTSWNGIDWAIDVFWSCTHTHTHTQWDISTCVRTSKMIRIIKHDVLMKLQLMHSSQKDEFALKKCHLSVWNDQRFRFDQQQQPKN